MVLLVWFPANQSALQKSIPKLMKYLPKIDKFLYYQ